MQTNPVYREKIVQISAGQVLRDVFFEGCVIAADTSSSIAIADNVHCRNCIFLYDGMQVDDEEWMALVTRSPLVRSRS